jgi:Fibronectin type III domain.
LSQLYLIFVFISYKELPGKPTEITSDSSYTRGSIKWKKPDGFTGKYVVYCEKCPSRKKTTRSVPNITYKDLKPNMKYEVNIRVINDITEKTSKIVEVKYALKTKGKGRKFLILI